MTKNYVKPQIVFEDFSLSKNIAAGCDRLVNNPSKGTCAVLGTGGIAVFDGTVGKACVFKPEDLGGSKDEYDGFCYHVPADNNDLFNS